jgi:glutamine amidotransferase-like uncharacterized protein
MAGLSIRIYADRGVTALSLHRISMSLSKLFPRRSIAPLLADELIKGWWKEHTDLLVFPGGRDSLFMEKLQDVGNIQIREFVLEGGRYLGICGGAYYACKKIVFAKGDPLELVAERELGFFPGAAVGPVFKSHAFAYKEDGVSNSGACVPTLSTNNGAFPVYYNGGCLFKDAYSYKEMVDVVGTYMQLQGEDNAAVVRCHVGQGKALLSGVHLEIDVHREGWLQGLMTQYAGPEIPSAAFLGALLN